MGTIILLMVAHTDKSGNFHTEAEVTRTVSDVASVPVFRNVMGGYNNGAVAGTVTDSTATAGDAIRTMHEAIDGGKDLSDVAVVSDSSSSISVASYEGMTKFDLNFDNLPQNTLIIGAPASFGRPYKMLFTSLALVIFGFILIIIGMALNILDRKHDARALEESIKLLRYSNEHDFLTGVYSRPFAKARFEEATLQEQCYSVVLANIDDFKRVNDTYGHEAADALLKDVAHELVELMEEFDGEVFRYGGDEFLFLFLGRELHEGDPIPERILGVFRKQRQVGMARLRVFASIGIANSESATKMADVLSWSESAVARAKEQGKNTCVVYTKAMLDEDVEKECEREVVLDAIKNDGFCMVYQPQVDAATKEVMGFEALARMKSGALGPGTFIPIVEGNGWISRVGRIITKITIEQIGTWRKQGLTPPPVSINFSVGQLADSEYLSYLAGLLDEYEVPVGAIKLEVTESVCIEDLQSASAFFEGCRKMGLELVMDDFGSGYSSLGLLSNIPVEEVKIDKSFLDSYGGADDAAFLADVIGLVHDLGKIAVCEGVETDAQYGLLKDLRCDRIQGFYFGRPQTPELIEELLRGNGHTGR